MFQIERTGTFQILPNGREARCGEPWTTDYKWRAVANVERLTPEGWTIDNHAVPLIIDAARDAEPVSCEGFCQDACLRLVREIGSERASMVTVEIEGIPRSWIRYVWTRGDVA